MGLGVVLPLIGGVVSGIGSLAAASAQAQAAEHNARTAEYNAKVAERNRAAALDQAGVEAADKRRENRRQIGRIRATYGANGIDLMGSPLDVLEDTALEHALDVSRIGYQGELRAAGYEEEAVNQRRQAQLDKMSAKSARVAGYVGAAAGFLGGATQAYQGYSLART